MTTRRLRAVQEGEAPKPKPKPKTVVEAAKGGSQRALLVAMRDRVAEAVENAGTPARDLAALTKRLLEIARSIEALDARAAEDADSGDEVTDGDFDASAV